MDGKERATLIVVLVFLKVIVENLLIYLLLGRVSSRIGLDKGFLHEISVERRISKLGKDLDKSWIAVFAALRAMEALS